MIFYILYIILGVIVCYYTWTKFFSKIKDFITEDDFEKMTILFFFFGVFIWPLYLIEYLRQSVFKE